MVQIGSEKRLGGNVISLYKAFFSPLCEVKYTGQPFEHHLLHPACGSMYHLRSKAFPKPLGKIVNHLANAQSDKLRLRLLREAW